MSDSRLQLSEARLPLYEAIMGWSRKEVVFLISLYSETIKSLATRSVKQQPFLGLYTGMSIFWPPVLNSFWRNSENRGELSHKSSNYWQQPAVFLRLNNESKPKTKWSYWPVSSPLPAVTVVWSSIVVSEQNLQISAFWVFWSLGLASAVVSVAI